MQTRCRLHDLPYAAYNRGEEITRSMSFGRKFFYRLQSLLPVTRALHAENEHLRQQHAILQQQRDCLAEERDELLEHGLRLQREASEAQSRAEGIDALTRERDEIELHRQALEDARSRLEASLEQTRAGSEVFEHQRNELVLDRDELKAHVERLEPQVQRLRAYDRLLWAPPGHFYSPIVDPDDVHVRQWLREAGERFDIPLTDVHLDADAMLSLLGRLAAHYPEMPFGNDRRPDLRYCFGNDTFSYADGIVLYGFLRHFAPARVVEAGSGFSSALMMDVNDRFFDGRIALDFFDPYPGVVKSLLRENDRYQSAVREMRVQDVPDEVFTRLEANDILFIDSSHVAKCRSDVADYAFRILPLLKPGVLVHIHDVLYPFEYLAEWIVTENRSWNEAYIVRALLQNQSAWEILMFNDLMFNKYADRAGALMPLALRNTGGSLWLRKRF